MPTQSHETSSPTGQHFVSGWRGRWDSVRRLLIRKSRIVKAFEVVQDGRLHVMRAVVVGLLLDHHLQCVDRLNHGADGLSQIEVIDASETEELEVIYDVPQKYMNSNDSGLELTVPPEGSDTLNLDLTK